MLETTEHDLRYALRGMRRSPVFALVAVVTLALATGAISTALTVANTFFFRRLPVDRPAEVVEVAATRRHGTVTGYVSWPDYVLFRTHNQTLQGPRRTLFHRASVRVHARQCEGDQWRGSLGEFLPC